MGKGRDYQGKKKNGQVKAHVQRTRHMDKDNEGGMSLGMGVG